VLLLAAVALWAGCGGSGGTPAPPAFLRGPYLTRVGETAARLHWIARGGAPVEITAAASSGGAVVRARGGLLGGLRPDTRYHWTAWVDGRPAASGTLRTAPRDLSRPLEFIAFGDYGADTPAWRAVAAMATAQRPRLLVTTGDNMYLFATPELLDQRLFRPLSGLLAGAPDYGVLGDHDIVTAEGRRALVEALDWPGGGERYDLRYGPVQLVGLGLEADRADAAFAARALARPGPLARFVVVHHPVHAGNPLLPVIARAHVTAVLSGHLHAYERRRRPEAHGVPLLTVGTGGAPRNPAFTPRSPDAVVHLAEFGLLRVRLEARRATFTFVDLHGRARDRLESPLAP
jgi:hypothetical protein